MSDKKNYYYNRELSWMDFDARVLEEAQKKDNPLMERLRFLAITGSNLDEFFMVRVAGVKSQIASNYTKPDDSGMTPKELLSALDKKTHAFMEKQYSCLYRSILPVLKKQAEIFKDYSTRLSDQLKKLQEEFKDLRDASQNMAFTAAERENRRLNAADKYAQLSLIHISEPTRP